MTEIEASEALRRALKRTIAGTPKYRQCVGEQLDRHFSIIDIATILGGLVAVALKDAGLATFDADELKRHLGPPESATSTGAYALRRSTTIAA